MAGRPVETVSALPAESDSGAGDRDGRAGSAHQRPDHVAERRVGGEAETARDRRPDRPRRTNRQRARKPDRDAAVSAAVPEGERSEQELTRRTFTTETQRTQRQLSVVSC